MAVVRRLRWAAPAAVGINLLIFAFAAFLLQEREVPQDITNPVGVNLVKLEAPSLPEQEQIREPEKPREQQKLDFLPDVVQPELGPPGAFDLGVGVNLGDMGAASSPEDFVFESYELDQAPQPIVRVPPAYPYSARERGTEGAVQVKMLVTTEGTVGRVEILDARPEGIFEDAVRRALPQWTFRPGEVQGRPVTAWVVTTIRFNLD
jgi:protein TonB